MSLPSRPVIRPLGDRVFIKPSRQEEVKKGSLFIPESAVSSPQEGTVFAVGSKVQTLHPGDRVLFGKYVGSELYLDGVLYLIVREPNVMALL